ncbi:hypothetical protein ACF08O_11295 [Streptomyces paradoxus]
MGAGSASAAAFKCRPTSRDYVVAKVDDESISGRWVYRGHLKR